MLRVSILCVGKLKEAYLRDAVSEYQKRLSAFCKPDIVEIDECRVPDRPSQAQIGAAVEDEGRRILQKLPREAVVVPLCIEGRELSSERLAKTILDWQTGGKSHLVFIIGGSWGLSDAVKKKGDLCLSMSPMTFPHQLARVMLLEQLYRAAQINSGGQYHK